MKFSIFLHMERYDASVSHPKLFEDLLELCDMAEAGGMDKVWIGEHHAMEYTISPNPIPLLAAVAGRTKRIRLGAGTFIAPFWHPIRMAGEAALLDVISNGRAEVGLARGAYQFEFDRMLNGESATDGGKYLREMVPLLQPLWEGDVTHDGEVWKFPASTSVPKPVQARPPLWIAARDPESHKFAVANGCNVMATPLAKGDAEVADLMDKFENAVAAAPHITERPKIMILQHAHVHKGDDDWQAAAEGISFFFRSFGAWFVNKVPPVNGFQTAVPPVNPEKFPEYVPETLRKNVMIGKPDELIERLKGYEALGVDEYSIWVDNSLSFEEKRDSLRLFIDEVLPAFA
jgi:alkanesulfonate monooxygenase SsuD/methylene tetrahydromethanopterin reductase-like flavin-dependent oxidoreductase (luciferase family)